jgi:photosystem II stability/assembly factor-like uncharacterized protein
MTDSKGNGNQGMALYHVTVKDSRSRFCLRRTSLLLAFAALFSFSSVRLPAQQWQAIPLANERIRNAGYRGGEGAQVIRSIVISPSHPNFLVMGTDVGGIYRSLDGGANWQVCMVGWDARGGNHFAIDPRNPNRVIGVGGNSADILPVHGLYLSTNQGASWRHVLPRIEGNDMRQSVAYDPASFDPKRGYCTVAYYDSRDGGLFKTTDGGETWAQVNQEISGAVVKVHPTKGFVYLASNSNPGHGFYKSEDGGKTFRKVNANYTLGMDVVPKYPDHVYISRWDKILVSNDAGETFHPVGRNQGLPDNTPILDIRVSPANPNEMSCKHGGKQWWESYVYFTTDGGDTWKKPEWDNSLAFLPFTQPDMRCAYHPTDPNIVYSCAGGGWIVKSTDGGATYRWNSNGENAIMIGSSFNFSPTSPNTIFLSFQDYNAASSTDGGRLWTYRNPSGQGWGGFEYGGYGLDAQVMWSGDAPSWGRPRTLKISRDGGANWEVAKDSQDKPVVYGGPDVSYSDPHNPDICFASNWRSGDRGRSWSRMSGCDGVFTSNPIGKKELYGKHGDEIVCSTDQGATWMKAASVEGGFNDLAVDAIHRRLWVASQDRLKRYENGEWTTVDIPKDQRGEVRVGSVAIDPVNPNIVYAANHKDIYACDNAVVRSADGGRTWTNLTVTKPLANASVPGGPHEVGWLRVHPRTRELWAAGQCFGVWKIAPPDSTPQTVRQSRTLHRRPNK